MRPSCDLKEQETVGQVRSFGGGVPKRITLTQLAIPSRFTDFSGRIVEYLCIYKDTKTCRNTQVCGRFSSGKLQQAADGGMWGPGESEDGEEYSQQTRVSLRR